jgi:chromosome segregation ATPase
MNTKDAYYQQLRAKLDEWNAEIDLLQAKASQADAEARVQLQEEIRRLHAQQKTAQTKLDALRRSGEGAWEDMKAGLEAAWDALGSAVVSARTRFK